MKARSMFGSLLNVGLTRTRVPTATPEDDRGEKCLLYEESHKRGECGGVFCGQKTGLDIRTPSMRERPQPLDPSTLTVARRLNK